MPTLREKLTLDELTLDETRIKPVVRSSGSQGALTDRVRESVLARVVRSSQQGLSRGLLDLRVEGGGE